MMHNNPLASCGCGCLIARRRKFHRGGVGMGRTLEERLKHKGAAMEWYLGVLKKYTVFDGRARRKEYWMFFLFHMIVAIALVIVESIVLFPGVLSGIYMLGTLLPAIGVSIRRLHDTGKSGWWIFISLVPIIGGLWYLYLMVIDGSAGDNQYGANPKGVAAA